MNIGRRFRRPVTLGLGFVLLAARMDAAVREFTDTSGRTVRGELVFVTGDQVTIKREDGQTFTTRATTFSKADIEFFKKNGLKESAVPAVATVGTPAATAPMRLDVKIMSGKQEQQGKYFDDKNQRISYRVEIKNSESQRDLEKAHGILLAFAKLVRYNDQTEIISREEFDCSIKALGSFSYDTQKPTRIRYYVDSFAGLRGSGYLLVLKDPSGKVLNVTGSSETLAKNYEPLLKLKVYTVFDRNYKTVKENEKSYINN